MALVASASRSLWSLSSDNNATYVSAQSLFFNQTFIPADGLSYIVPTSFQYVLFGEMTVDGDLTLNGDLVLFG